MRIEKRIELEKTVVGLVVLVLIVALLGLTGCTGPVERHDPVTVENLHEAEYISRKDARPDLHPAVKRARADWFKAAREYELAKPGAPEGASPEYVEPDADVPETPEEPEEEASNDGTSKGDGDADHLLRAMQGDGGAAVLPVQGVRGKANRPDRAPDSDPQATERRDGDYRYRAEVRPENRAGEPSAGPCVRRRDAEGHVDAAGGRAGPGEIDAGAATRGGGSKPRASGALRDRRRDGGRDQDSSRAAGVRCAGAFDCGDGIAARSVPGGQDGQAGFAGRGLDPVHRPGSGARPSRRRALDQRELRGVALSRSPERRDGAGARACRERRQHRRPQDA